MWKKHRTTIILIGMLLTGLSLLLYPSFSNYWNSFHATRAIASYAEETASLNEAEYAAMLQDAHAYNQAKAKNAATYALTDEQQKVYQSLLDVSGTGIMGYIEINSIGVSLPIYHGTEDSVLQIAVGHLDWSSLPVGGESTHCVMSGHRGLPSAKLFTNLDQLVVGDTFMVRVLDEVLTYEVDQILIVEPDDVSALKIVPGEDLCTLVTCTPYGINSHRLLVRGHRVENAIAADLVRVTSDAVKIEPVLVAPVLAMPVLLVLLILLLLPRKNGKKQGADAYEK
ncbi:MAG: class C sortase [Peptococcaceae bacterium]|nr:class C sortase [Peptococcaceae bacterium]